jgi:nucleotide-binding universal stress UspA family protein
VARFTHILVPVDFSGASARALGYGLSLALEMEARLTLTHVIPFSPSLAYMYPVGGPELAEGALDGVRAKLVELLDPAYREDLKADFRVKTGDVQDELLKTIEDVGPDLVVMGTHGRRRFQRWILGSVTEHILRRADTPLLTVSHLDEEHLLPRPLPVPLAKLIYATDLSSESIEGMQWALDLAREFSAELVVLHVVQNLGWALGNEFIPLDVESRTAQARQAAFDFLIRSIPESARSDPKIRVELREGVPYEVILSFADSEAADLILLNTQRRGAVDRVLLGSTAERVVRGGRVPVLSIPGRPA